MTTRRLTAYLALAVATVTVTLAATVAPVLAVPARAAGGRLQGNYDIVLTVVKAKNTGDKPGQKADRTYFFKPRCKQGACTTVFYREYGEGDVHKYPVRPDRRGVYGGGLRQTVSCYNGHQVVKRAYHYSESATITPTAVHRGEVQKFRGTVEITYTATKVGAAHGCKDEYEKFTMRGGPYTGGQPH